MLPPRCIRLTDEGTVPLAEACRRLEVLSLHGIQGITDRRAFLSCTLTQLYLPCAMCNVPYGSSLLNVLSSPR